MHERMGNGEKDLEAMRKLVLGYKQARKEGLAPKNPHLEGLLVAMEEEDFQLKLPGERKERSEMESEEIFPDPFFVIKTVNKNRSKVFINVCGSSKIALPGDWVDGVPCELENTLASIDSEQGVDTLNLRLSLSCSPPVNYADKSGKPCLVYDVVFNLDVVKQSMVHRRLKLFLVEMAMAWISEKYKTELNPDFKLPKAKYKGQFVAPHYIRAPKVQLVTELPDVDKDPEPSFPLFLDKRSSSVDCKVSDTSPTHTTSKQLTLETSDIYSSNLSLQAKEEVLSTSCHNPLCETTVCGLPNNMTKCNISLTKANLTVNHESLPDLNLQTNLQENQKYEQEPLNEVCKTKKDGPMIEMEYSGCPVTLCLIRVKFASFVRKQDMYLYVSNTCIYLEVSMYEALKIPLTFPTMPNEVEAWLFPSEGLLQLSLPFLPYHDLIKVGGFSLAIDFF